MATFRILPGLPPYGPLAVPFTATGTGTHREGLVVEFTDGGAEPWTGNFQRGFTGLDASSQIPGAIAS